MEAIEQVSDAPMKVGRPVGAKDSKPRQRQGFGRGELAMRLQRLQTTGALAGTSSAVLLALADREYWLRLIDRLEGEGEWRTLVDVLKFHQQMRDGRPAQQINLTSMNVSVSAAEIAQARATVSELRRVTSPAKSLKAEEL